MPAAKAQRVQWIAREDALEALGLKDRRLRDYIAAGKIKTQDGLLHAGDVARIQAERQEKKDGAQVRALATMEPEVRKATKLAETRALLQAAGGQVGNPATAALPSRKWLTIEEAEEYLGLPSDHITDAIFSGELKARDVGVRRGIAGRFRIHIEDLDELGAKDCSA